jgi:V8-like Glu-specific endopeptidase
MRHRLPALLVSAMLLVLIVAPVQARGPQPSRHEQIVAHWTPARMAAAIPRDFDYHPGRGFAPAAKPPGTPGGPGGGGGDGDGTGFTNGASWTAGGVIKERTGKVYFEMDGVGYVCSGTVATDGRSTVSLVLTAGHCAYDETNEEFATNWLFIPDFDQSPTFTCANTEYGCWTAQALVVHEGYATAGGFNTQATLHDFAFAVVGPGGKSGTAQLDTTVGSYPVVIPGFTASGQTSYAFGYPAAGKYKGNDLTYCAGSIFEDPYNDELTWGVPCKMTGGSSGGPWLSSFNTSTTAGGLSSLNSYGYSGVAAMHGPKFNSDTAAVLNAANSATGNRIVP